MEDNGPLTVNYDGISQVWNPRKLTIALCYFTVVKRDNFYV